MQVIDPVVYTYGMMISSNVAENDFPTWMAPAARAIGDQVILNHKIYKAVIAMTSSTDVNPETGTGAATKWQLQGATNRWRMLDDRVGSLTTNTGTIEVVIKPGQVIGGIALFNLSGKSVTIKIEDGSNVVYTKVIPLVDYNVSDWYSYFYSPVRQITDMVQLDLPSYGNANVRIIVDSGSTSGTASVGAVVMGVIESVGEAQYGTQVGINDYSRKEVDAFGNPDLVVRGFSKFGDFPVEVSTHDEAQLGRLYARMRARLAVWIGYEGYESTIIYGFFKEYTLTLQDSEWSEYQLRIEGVV